MNSSKYHAGVDEAGRGAVLGPLVACCFTAGEEKAPLLTDMGVDDSKRLTPSVREKLLPALIRHSESVHWTFLSPFSIDGENLNTLYTRNVIQLINKSPASHVVVDAPVPPQGLEKYRSYLQAMCDNAEVDAQNRAEEHSVYVAAASICAKVIRDRVISAIGDRYGVVGSGYPSDPTTVTWLKDHYDLGVEAGIIRKKWKLTCF